MRGIVGRGMGFSDKLLSNKEKGKGKKEKVKRLVCSEVSS